MTKRRTSRLFGFLCCLLVLPTVSVGESRFTPPKITVPDGFEIEVIAILWPIVFLGAFIGSKWGLESLRTRSVELIFIIVIFIAAAKLIIDMTLII